MHKHLTLVLVVCFFFRTAFAEPIEVPTPLANDAVPLTLIISSLPISEDTIRISTQGSRPTQLYTVSGSTVTLAKTKTAEKLAGITWHSISTEERVVSEDSIQITPVVDNQYVTLTINKRNQRLASGQWLATTVKGKLDEWIAVLGPPPRENMTVYTTQDNKPIPERLHVLVKQGENAK